MIKEMIESCLPHESLLNKRHKTSDESTALTVNQKKKWDAEYRIKAKKAIEYIKGV